MSIAALILWALTALGGFVLLAKWVANGGARQQSTTHLNPPIVFSHFLLAAAGLVLWIVYLATSLMALAWVSLVLLVIIALLGFAMVAKWLPVYQNKAAAGADAPPEKHFPVAVVAGHGLLAVGTVLTVLLATIGVGG